MSGKKSKAIRRTVRREIRRADVESKKPRWVPKSVWKGFIKRVSLAFKPQTKPIKIQKRRNDMSGNGGKRTAIPMGLPNAGDQPQVQIDINDTTEQLCLKCHGQHFELVMKLRVFSRLSPKNPSGKDALIKMEVYLCRDCGHEYGKPVIEDGKAD